MSGFVHDSQGVASAEKAIERLTSARLRATKEANRFTLISLIFVAIYGVKILGLRADLVILDQKVFEVPYGIFLFCVCSQVSYSLSLARSIDARVWDRYILGICDLTWPDNGRTVYDTIPNEDMWLDAGNRAMNRISEYPKARVIYSLLLAPTFIFSLMVAITPIAVGVYYLIDWQKQIVTGDINIQYYAVLFTTICSASWFIGFLILFFVDDHD